MESAAEAGLAAAVALCADCVRPAALAASDDPLRLGLPVLVDGATGLVPSPELLRSLAGLYLQAELEQAGIIVAAELLAQQRAVLNVTSAVAAGRLEEFVEKARRWYDRGSRDALFARVFGIGSGDGGPGGVAVNRDFQQRLASLCHSLVLYEREFLWSRTPSSGMEVALYAAIGGLLLNLGARQYGNIPFAARSVHEQLTAAIEVLNDPGIGALVGGRGLWDTLRRLYGDSAPDFGRLLRRGQSGQQVLLWVAYVAPQWRNGAGRLDPVPAASPVFLSAAAWLQASGIEVAVPRPPFYPRRA